MSNTFAVASELRSGYSSLRVARQLSIAGTEPAVHADVDDAIDELARARSDQKRATERVRVAESVLCQRMLSAKVARYDHVDGGHGEWTAELALPEPSVRLKYVGNRSGED